VASGISEALLTTIFGLTVAVPIQIAYNLFTARVDSIIVDMEENSMNLIETISLMNQEKEKSK